MLDMCFTEVYAQSFEDLIAERVPIFNLFGGGVGGRVVMEVDQFGTVMMDELGHHDSVCEIPVDVLLGTRKRDTIHQLVHLL